MTVKELKNLRVGDRVQVTLEYGYCDEVDKNVGCYCEVLNIYNRLILVRRCDKRDFVDKYNELTGKVRLYNYTYLKSFN